MHLHTKGLGHREPDGFSEVILDVGWQLREAITVSAKDVILGVGHVSEFTDQVLERVDANSVGSNTEAGDHSNFMGEIGRAHV